MPTDNPFGLLAFLAWNHAWNDHAYNESNLDRSIAQIKELGSPMVRLDIYWFDVHRGPGQFDFSKYDRIVAALQAHHIPILGLLHYNRDYGVEGKNEVWNKPPTSFDEFAGYVERTVHQYKKWISHWEIWNEPNHPDYWAAPPDQLKTYSKLLKKSYHAAKKADSNCLVLNGGLAQPVEEAVQHLYQNGSQDDFDILNIHPFMDPAIPNAEQVFHEMIEKILTIMKRFKDGDKKIWITEMGCPGIPPGIPSQKWFAGEGLNESQQAAWLKTLYGWVQKHPHVEKMFWAFYRDTDGMFKDSTDYFGLVRNDFSPKPSYSALQKLISTHS